MCDTPYIQFLSHFIRVVFQVHRIFQLVHGRAYVACIISWDSPYLSSLTATLNYLKKSVGCCISIAGIEKRWKFRSALRNTQLWCSQLTVSSRYPQRSRLYHELVVKLPMLWILRTMFFIMLTWDFWSFLISWLIAILFGIDKWRSMSPMTSEKNLFLIVENDKSASKIQWHNPDMKFVAFCKDSFTFWFIKHPFLSKYDCKSLEKNPWVWVDYEASTSSNLHGSFVCTVRLFICIKHGCHALLLHKIPTP